MKCVLPTVCLLLMLNPAFGENRFGRPVVKVKDATSYQFIKSDDVSYPTVSNDRFSVSCLVYRGTEHYYVEVKITNRTHDPVFLRTDFIDFDKPGYSLDRTDTIIAAREAAAAGGARFTPTPPPYVPPTYNTTVNATATTYGNETNISGTATTTEDDSGQAGANLGNAIGNAIAAHRFYKMQRTDVAFSHFLATHVQTASDTALQPGRNQNHSGYVRPIKAQEAPFRGHFESCYRYISFRL